MAEQKVIHSDNITYLKTLPDNVFDSVVTDPPYGLSFMGKKWDYDVPSVELWMEVFRVLKPGGHLLSFAGTRTQHRMACNIEDAGFEIRDMIAWVYGSGFPKSLDVSKALDKSQGAEREVVGVMENHRGKRDNPLYKMLHLGSGLKTSPATDDAKQWSGWGTALKPAMEPITVARKPIDGTVANNILKWGCGGINIDGGRVPTQDKTQRENNGVEWGDRKPEYYENRQPAIYGSENGRFPANFIHDGSEEVLEMFPETTVCGGPKKTTHNDGMFGIGHPGRVYNLTDTNTSAARFFYCAKASKGERNKGLEEFPDQLKLTQMRGANGTGEKNFIGGFQDQIMKNTHPTVKPVSLMRYLVRLVTPPNGHVLDPFAGSGTTLIGAKLEGVSATGIEMDEQYCKIAQARVQAWVEEKDKQMELF